MYKFAAAIILMTFLSGCATTPKEPVDTSWYSKPTEGKAGIFFYQRKTGILGALYDVKFILNGESLGKINTGEWLYFEVPPGQYKSRFKGGLIPQHANYNFVAGNNYFFRGFILQASPYAIPVYKEEEVREVIQNIESGRYKPGKKD